MFSLFNVRARHIFLTSFLTLGNTPRKICPYFCITLTSLPVYSLHYKTIIFLHLNFNFYFGFFLLLPLTFPVLHLIKSHPLSVLLILFAWILPFYRSTLSCSYSYRIFLLSVLPALFLLSLISSLSCRCYSGFLYTLCSISSRCKSRMKDTIFQYNQGIKDRPGIQINLTLSRFFLKSCPE